MKKSLLLLVAGAMAVSASAQYARPSSLLLSREAVNPNGPTGKKITLPTQAAGTPARHSAGRTTSITSCTYTETFPPTVLTTGGSGGAGDIWTTQVSSAFGATGAGLWHQTTTASTSGNNIGTLASTTASNGWMIFDCDSVRGTSTTTTPGAWLQSPAINCTGLATVGLSFQELYQGGVQDTCVVEVSTSSTFASGVTYYPVYRNNLFTYERTANPDTILLDITSAAAGHTVYIRFVFQDLQYWGFSWLLDDVCVGALSGHDVGLYHDFVYESNGSATAGAEPGSIFEMPLEFIDHTDSLSPVTTLTNYAHAVETTVPVTANIYGPTGATAYSQTLTYSNLPINAIDSVVQFNGYVPNVIGAYTVAFDAALTTDTDPGNNVDTSTFYVSDTTWNDNYGQLLSDYAFYVYASAATTGSTAIEQFYGSRFDVAPNVVGDTVSGFGVGFSSSSVPTNATGSVMVQLYSQDPTSGTWTWQGSSVSRKLTASDYSTSSGIVYAYFPTFTGYGANGGGNFVLSPNTTYAAVVQTNGVTNNLLIMATDISAATYFNVGYTGEGYASNNDGGTNFGSTSATGETVVPLVNMYFGNIKPQNEGVKNVTLDNNIGQAYPNPASNSFAVPFTMAQDNTVTVTLMDMTGQIINKTVVKAIGGQATSASFNTSTLAEGMYIYSVQANGASTTGRVVVAH